MGRATDFFRVGPRQHDHLPALRVALGVAIPLVLLLWAGRIDLTIYAVFGSFTGIFGRGEAHWLRVQHQVQAGGLILAGTAVGLLTALYSSTAQHDDGPWAVVVGSILVAGAGSVASDRLGIRPAGPFFPLFAFAACASIPSSAPLTQSLGVAVLAFLLSLIIGASGWIRPRHRGTWPGRRRVTPPDRRTVAVNASRFALAAGVAGSVAVLTGLGHNYWAILSAVVPLAAATRSMRLERAGWRVTGTLAGVGITALIVAAGPVSWQLVLIVIVLQFGAEMFVVRHYGLAMLFITPLALLMTQLAHPITLETLLAERVLETGIGAVVGVVIVLLIRDPRTQTGTGVVAG